MTTADAVGVQVMYRERAAGMYSELPFAAAQCLIEVPYNLAQTFVFCCISYFMLGFDHTAGKHLKERTLMCGSGSHLAAAPAH